MKSFKEAYKKYAEAAMLHDQYWSNYPWDEPNKVSGHGDEPVSLEEVLNKSKEATEAYRRLIGSRDLHYEGCIDSELRNAAKARDYIRIRFLLHLMVLYPPRYEVVEALIFVVQELVDVYLAQRQRDNKYTWRHAYILEQVMDVLMDYPDQSLIPVLKQMCSMDIGAEETTDIVIAVSKAVDVLKLIQSQEAIDIIRYCADHRHPDIKRKARRILTWMEGEGLIESG